MTLWLQDLRRIAVLHDLAGNVDALERALEYLAGVEIDALVFLGDLVAGGDPERTLARIDEATVMWPVRFVIGQTDEHLVAGDGSDLDKLTDDARTRVEGARSALEFPLDERLHFEPNVSFGDAYFAAVAPADPKAFLQTRAESLGIFGGLPQGNSDSVVGPGSVGRSPHGVVCFAVISTLEPHVELVALPRRA